MPNSRRNRRVKEEQVLETQDVLTFDEITPKASNNRMDWSPANFEAAYLEDVEVKMSKTNKPYIKFIFADKPIIATLVEQLIADTGNEFIISEEGEPIEVDLSVPIGVSDGKFFVPRV